MSTSNTLGLAIDNRGVHPSIADVDFKGCDLTDEEKSEIRKAVRYKSLVPSLNLLGQRDWHVVPLMITNYVVLTRTAAP